MLKFIRGKGHHPSAERIKLQKSLFSFKRTIQHGFPTHPSTMAWDPELKLLAVGTKGGEIKIFGAPGVEFYGRHRDEVMVTQLHFLPSMGRVVSLLEDNSLHLWEINVDNDGRTVLEEVKSCPFEGNTKRVSVITVGSDHLYVGTEGGNIYLFDPKSFTFTDTVLNQDAVVKNATDDFKVNLGAVEVILENPKDSAKLLIGYTRGMMVLWDVARSAAEQTYAGTQRVESAWWHRDGQKFVTAYNDGSYVVWNANDSTKPAEGANNPYGPFPCKTIGKVQWKSAKTGDYVIFDGGMPRASYGDRNTVSVIRGKKHVVFDFTSKVLEFVVVSSEDSQFDNPDALLVLTEEELVAIDLQHDDWRAFHPPYLNCLHSSAITCAQQVSNVSDAIWRKMADIGNLQKRATYSTRPWPVTGGRAPETTPATHDLLLTGHEDGSVKFWDATGVALSLIFTVSSASIFNCDEMLSDPSSNADANEEEWPPFRKVGCFDPFTDDPRLGIKKLAFCCLTGTLVAAGTAGQFVVYTLSDAAKDLELQSQKVNIVRDGFAQKGQDQLGVKPGTVHFPAGLVPTSVVQLYPPAACTAIGLHSEWELVAVGTEHGFVLFDYSQNKSVMTKCTLSPYELAGTGDTSMSRRKSLKKSLRESFRRIRKGRSQRTRKSPQRGEDKKVPAPHEPKPVERQVEARNVDDALGSMVRCLYLSSSYIVSLAKTTPTLWAGTNSGAVFVFTIALPQKDKRKEGAVVCSLGKEIQLKHRAPVIGITILDSAYVPLPDPGEVEAGRAKAPETAGFHRVLICSEEQFKLFTLPSLKPGWKSKITAHDGARIRRVGWADFKSSSNEKYSEWCVTSLTNLGDVSVYSLPDLRRQMTVGCIRKEDINGILSLVFTRTGEALYLHSTSELQRISLSPVTGVRILGSVELPEGARRPVEPVDAPQTAPSSPKEEEMPRHEVSIVWDTDEQRKDTSAEMKYDTVRDRVTTTVDDSQNIVTQRKEERVEVERKEHVTTILKTGTVTAASEEEAIAAILAQETSI